MNISFNGISFSWKVIGLLPRGLGGLASPAFFGAAPRGDAEPGELRALCAFGDFCAAPPVGNDGTVLALLVGGMAMATKKTNSNNNKRSSMASETRSMRCVVLLAIIVMTVGLSLPDKIPAAFGDALAVLRAMTVIGYLLLP